jgi:hypothetical protein
MAMQMKSSRGRIKLTIILIAVVVIGFFLWEQVFGTYRLAEIEKGVLYSTGVRKVEDLNNAALAARAKAVLLCSDTAELETPLLTASQNYVFHNKMRLENFSVGPGNWPTTQDINQALQAIDWPSRRPLLIASADGVRRPAMIVAAYLTSVMKYDKPAAMKRLHQLYGDAPGLADVDRFLEVYEPASRKVTQQLPLSKE